MSRRNRAPKVLTEPDHVYGSRLVHLLINRVLQSGKKSIAQRIVYTALKIARSRTKRNPISVFETAVINVTPRVGVKPRRHRGKIRFIPTEIRVRRGTKLSIRWISDSAKKRSGKSMSIKLARELLAAYRKSGIAIRKRRNSHHMAASNKAFAHFGRRRRPFVWLPYHLWQRRLRRKRIRQLRRRRPPKIPRPTPTSPQGVGAQSPKNKNFLKNFPNTIGR